MGGLFSSKELELFTFAVKKKKLRCSSMQKDCFISGKGKSPPPARAKSRTMAFSESDCRRFKLLHIVELGGEIVLKYTLLCGTDNKINDVPLDDYLRTLPRTSTANFNRTSPSSSTKSSWRGMRRTFKSKESLIQTIKGKDWRTSDITLLNMIIKMACEKVADIHDSKWNSGSRELESLITKTTNIRNVVLEKKVMSEHDYFHEVRKFKDLCLLTLQATRDRYNRDYREVTVKMAEVEDAVDVIMRERLGMQEILQKYTSVLLPRVKKEANKEIRGRLASIGKLNPLHFLPGHENTKVDVHDIFSRIIIKEERNVKKKTDESRSDEKTTDHLKLLTLLTDGGRSSSSPQILIVEGEAGSGKTTLLTFLVAEWLKEASQRSVKGLQYFDLLMCFTCRHESSSTLESLIKNTFPGTFSRYGTLLLPLLREMKILIIIDGLDEETESSRQLVADIMSHGQHCPAFTVVCTSRPDGVMSMKAKAPENFKVFQTILDGISTEDRTDFVLKHIIHLNKGEPIDTARLRQVMQQIGCMELFRLPLNLLFLSLMFIEDPQKLSTRITQTMLYQNIVNLTVEKLHFRVAAKEKRFMMKKNEILKVIQEAFLRALLHDTLYIREEDLDTLRSTCGESCDTDVLSSFFCLQREVVCGVSADKYRSPHIGLREFLAAHHILGRLDMHRQGDIRRVLQEYTQGPDLQLPLRRSLLSQVLGLLSSEEKRKVSAIEETVDLIQESGVKKTAEWLSVMAEKGCHHSAMARIAHYVCDDEEEQVTISDRTVHAASTLLPLISQKTISIDLHMDPLGAEDVLFSAVIRHAVKELSLWHHYKQPRALATSYQLLQRCPRDDLLWFVGHLDSEHLPMLPRCLRLLRLCVAGDEHARALLPQLLRLKEYCPSLRHLVVHVPVTSPTALSLTPLPRAQVVPLVLSGVADTKTEDTEIKDTEAEDTEIKDTEAEDTEIQEPRAVHPLVPLRTHYFPSLPRFGLRRRKTEKVLAKSKSIPSASPLPSFVSDPTSEDMVTGGVSNIAAVDPLTLQRTTSVEPSSLSGESFLEVMEHLGESDKKTEIFMKEYEERTSLLLPPPLPSFLSHQTSEDMEIGGASSIAAVDPLTLQHTTSVEPFSLSGESFLEAMEHLRESDRKTEIFTREHAERICSFPPPPLPSFLSHQTSEDTEIGGASSIATYDPLTLQRSAGLPYTHSRRRTEKILPLLPSSVRQPTSEDAGIGGVSTIATDDPLTLQRTPWLPDVNTRRKIAKLRYELKKEKVKSNYFRKKLAEHEALLSPPPLPSFVRDPTSEDTKIGGASSIAAVGPLAPLRTTPVVPLSLSGVGDTEAEDTDTEDTEIEETEVKEASTIAAVGSIAVGSLTPLPPAPVVSLVLSGVGYTEIEAACSTAAAMCPEKERYRSISFPGASLDGDGCKKLLEGLAAAGVRVDYWFGHPGEGVRVPNTFVTEDEERDLNRLAWSLLRCALFREPEEHLWRV